MKHQPMKGLRVALAGYTAQNQLATMYALAYVGAEVVKPGTGPDTVPHYVIVHPSKNAGFRGDEIRWYEEMIAQRYGRMDLVKPPQVLSEADMQALLDRLFVQKGKRRGVAKVDWEMIKTNPHQHRVKKGIAA